MLNSFKRYFNKIAGPRLKYKHDNKIMGLPKLGSSYGGWIIPVTGLNDWPVCYLAGTGEDILQDNLDISILCVEFHSIEDKRQDLIQSAIKKLEEGNYIVAARENLDFTFVSRKHYESKKNESGK